MTDEMKLDVGVKRLQGLVRIRIAKLKIERKKAALEAEAKAKETFEPLESPIRVLLAARNV